LRVLLVTGLMAKEVVERYSKQSDKETSIIALPISIAAFMTPEFAAQELQKRDLTGINLILLPGAVRGDVSVVETATGIPTFKGPLYAADIPSVLEYVAEVPLSKMTPASDLLQSRFKTDLQRELETAEQEGLKSMEADGGFFIGKGNFRVALGASFPMRVVAEIVDAPRLSDAEIEHRASYYVESGADIVDFGMIAGEPHQEEIKRIVEAARATITCPISIDTLNPKEIRAAVKAEMDLVLSLDLGNVDELAPFVQDTPVVITPTNMKKGLHFPMPAQRVAALEDCIGRARELGIRNVIADPILDPPVSPGFLKALEAYSLFSKRNPAVPLFLGAGNVTELIDIDSTGINGLLAAAASELGACLLFAPEHSDKARGSISELATASRMMLIAKRRHSVPKDLCLNMLILKDKRFREEPYDRALERSVEILEPKDTESFEEDRKGWFKILLDRSARKIVLLHFPSGQTATPSMVLKGTTAKTLYHMAIEKGLLSKLEHAAYLGNELAKAEIALSIGKSYIQDETLFTQSLLGSTG